MDIQRKYNYSNNHMIGSSRSYNSSSSRTFSSRNCYNCNQPGHISKMCPNLGNGSSRFHDGSRNNYGGSHMNGFGSESYRRPQNDIFDFEGPKEVLQKRSEVLKNFYVPHPMNLSRTAMEYQDFLQKHEMNVKGNETLNPILSFEETTFPEPFMKQFKSQAWTCPTPIQSMAWPYGLSGRDLVAIAQTGSGKTLAFILPALIHIANQARTGSANGPICVVLVPTRELCQQVEEVGATFGSVFGIRVLGVYGGAPKYNQLRDLRTNPQVIVACPGRLLDFLSTKKVQLDSCSYLVLDEADRMLDMGFEPQIRKIVKRITCRERQTLMFSATWPKEVHKLANDFLFNYIHISLGASFKLKANKNIKQIIKVVDEWNKDNELCRILSDIVVDGKEHKILIFVKTKVACNEMNVSARNMGWPVDCIHGDKKQVERDQVLRDFKNGRKTILIATDVAARGLDVDDIEYVINYDFPNSLEEYVHRIGRTARMGKHGVAFSFFTAKDAKLTQSLKEVLIDAAQEVPSQLDTLMSMRDVVNPGNKRRWNGGSRMGRGGGAPNRSYGVKRKQWS